MSSNSPEEQKRKNGQIPTEIGHRAAVDKHPPDMPDRTRKPKNEAASKTSLSKKRERDSPSVEATPAKKKPSAKPKLGAEKTADQETSPTIQEISQTIGQNDMELEENKTLLTKLKEDREGLRKKQKEVENDIERNTAELEKTQNARKKLLQQNIQDCIKKIGLLKKDEGELNSST